MLSIIDILGSDPVVVAFGNALPSAMWAILGLFVVLAWATINHDMGQANYLARVEIYLANLEQDRLFQEHNLSLDRAEKEECMDHAYLVLWSDEGRKVIDAIISQRPIEDRPTLPMVVQVQDTPVSQEELAEVALIQRQLQRRRIAA